MKEISLWRIATSRYTYGTAFADALTDLNTYMQKHVGEPTQYDKMDAEFPRVLCFLAIFFSAIFSLISMASRLQAGSVDQQMAEDGYTKIANPTIIINQYGNPEPKNGSAKCRGMGFRKAFSASLRVTDNMRRLRERNENETIKKEPYESQ